MVWDAQKTIARRLIGWSLICLVLGAILWLNPDPFWRGFGLQALVWGLIDALIGLLGMRGLTEKLNRPVNLSLARRDEANLRRILWINTALDILYILAGLGLALFLARGDTFQRGSGWGVVAQGSFLFLFDMLHALSVPTETELPNLHIFDAPEHLPFQLEGSRGTAVLVHGFPGTPKEMRAIGEALQRQGWAVNGLLLSGFGRDLPRLFQQRSAAWIDEIAQAVQHARQNGRPVLLVGFSMGGGLSVAAAAQSRPDGLVLLSPFWINENTFVTGLASFLRLFFPTALRPFRGRLISPDSLRRGALELSPDLNMDDPALTENLRRLRLPIIFVDQFREIGFRIKKHAAQVACPVLIVRGSQDPVVKEKPTRQLARLFSTPPQSIEVPGGHTLYLGEEPGFSLTEAALAEFSVHIHG